MKALLTNIFIVVLISSVVIGCTKERHDRSCESEDNFQCYVDSNLVNVRIVNRSIYPICSLIMKINSSDSLHFAYVEVGDSSCYTPVPKAIESPALDFMVGVEPSNKPYGTFAGGGTVYDEEKTFITYYIDNVRTNKIIVNKQDTTIIVVLEPSVVPQVVVYP